MSKTPCGMPSCAARTRVANLEIAVAGFMALAAERGLEIPDDLREWGIARLFAEDAKGRIFLDTARAAIGIKAGDPHD